MAGTASITVCTLPCTDVPPTSSTVLKLTKSVGERLELVCSVNSTRQPIYLYWIFQPDVRHRHRRQQGGICRGKPGNFTLTGSDLPSHWFV